MLTRILIAINVLAYVWETTTGDPSDTRSLIEHGALYGPAVAAGEWWRIVSGAFLHASIIHIATNMFALYQVGTFVEMLYGRTRMLLMYAAGIAGSGAAVLLFSFDTTTVGASGAVFTLFGALLAAGVRLGKPGRQIMQQSAGIIVLNLLLGFTLFSGYVSNAAHIGGLIVGIVLGFVLFMGSRFRIAEAETAPVPVATDGGIYEPPEYIATAHPAPPHPVATHEPPGPPPQ
jgi:rhomboid protease GluP